MKREILNQSRGKSGSSSPNGLSPSRKYVFRFIYAKKKTFKTLKLCPLLPGGYIWNVIVHGKHLDDN